MITQSEIHEINRKSALEQVEQDERNDDLRAEMKADQLVNGRPPRRPSYFKENYPGEELDSVERENISIRLSNAPVVRLGLVLNLSDERSGISTEAAESGRGGEAGWGV